MDSTTRDMHCMVSSFLKAQVGRLLLELRQHDLDTARAYGIRSELNGLAPIVAELAKADARYCLADAQEQQRQADNTGPARLIAQGLHAVAEALAGRKIDKP